MSLSFRWLGVAGIELVAEGQRLAIDPFFSRPSLLGMLKPVYSNASLLKEKLPDCHFILVTHSHWDHLMDVPEVLRQTGSAAYGSRNTCQLLRLHNIPASKVHKVHVGDHLSLGLFKVEVVAGQHSPIPLASIFNGALTPGMQPPLRLQDYRMDICLGYCITVMGVRLLICAAQPQRADVLFAVAQEPKSYYLRLFRGVQPQIFVPIHWDNFLRSLGKPLQRFTRPGRMKLGQLVQLAHQVLPQSTVIVPDIFKIYDLQDQ